jgi:hypothetical protein
MFSTRFGYVRSYHWDLCKDLLVSGFSCTCDVRCGAERETARAAAVQYIILHRQDTACAAVLPKIFILAPPTTLPTLSSNHLTSTIMQLSLTTLVLLAAIPETLAWGTLGHYTVAYLATNFGMEISKNRQYLTNHSCTESSASNKNLFPNHSQ